MTKTDKTLFLKIGMLWYEKDADDVYTMISAAAAHYFAKFGKVPRYCHVHPIMFKNEQTILKQPDNMKIILDKTIRPNHVWVGVIR